MDAWERIYKLREIIIHHNQLYYENDTPEISDFEYDALMNELISLEKEFPLFASPDSPPKKWGAQHWNDLGKSHTKMLCKVWQMLFPKVK